MHRSLWTDGSCGLLVMQVLRLWLLVLSFSILIFCFFIAHPVVCTYVYTAGSGCFSCCSVWDRRGRWLPQVGERVVGEARMVISLVGSNASCPSVPLANLLSMCPHQVWYRAVAAPEFSG